MNEEEIYELVSQEIDEEKTKKGLWTKAFSKSDGDENKTKALYIKYRFDQIKSSQPDVLDGQIDEREEKSFKEDPEKSKSDIKSEDKENKNVKDEETTNQNRKICYFCAKPNAEKSFFVDGVLEWFCSADCHTYLGNSRVLERSRLKEGNETRQVEQRKENVKESISAIKNDEFENTVKIKRRELGEIKGNVNISPEKFGGFLLFFACLFPLGIIVAPIAGLIEMGSMIGAYRGAPAEIKEAVSTFSMDSTILQICVTIFSIYLLYLFYKKKRNFPVLYSWTIVLSWLGQSILVMNFFSELEKYVPKGFKSIFFNKIFSEPKLIIPFIIQLALLIYFNYSTRVKNTFTQ